MNLKEIKITGKKNLYKILLSKSSPDFDNKKFLNIEIYIPKIKLKIRNLKNKIQNTKIKLTNTFSFRSYLIIG